MQLDGPILDKIKIDFDENTDFSTYPFSLNIIANLKEITFPTQVTFFIGENGAGKSTILESIAAKVGFGKEGGSKNINFNTADDVFYSDVKKLSDCLTLFWRKKPRDGYFFRAESFFNLANHIDEIAKQSNQSYDTYASYGGKSLHKQSHGESFLSFFKSRIGGGGFYIFDEPEAALSPQRQLTLLSIINDVCKNKESQFIIATHSPILLAYPSSKIYSCDEDEIKEIKYEETKHYEISKNFLNNPKQYFKHLFNRDEI